MGRRNEKQIHRVKRPCLVYFVKICFELSTSVSNPIQETRCVGVMAGLLSWETHFAMPKYAININIVSSRQWNPPMRRQVSSSASGNGGVSINFPAVYSREGAVAVHCGVNALGEIAAVKGWNGLQGPRSRTFWCTAWLETPRFLICGLRKCIRCM